MQRKFRIVRFRRKLQSYQYPIWSSLFFGFMSNIVLFMLGLYLLSIITHPCVYLDFRYQVIVACMGAGSRLIFWVHFDITLLAHSSINRLNWLICVWLRWYFGGSGCSLAWAWAVMLSISVTFYIDAWYMLILVSRCLGYRGDFVEIFNNL